ncbi:hypothetical protein IW261DRAFT_1426328 [Armillaria novae-zelandiae]|uniref:Uncharacterized protein n=1 Tax=Armillaria novae-zelandiae TaxID=153914 RepID=A0AA39NMR1_9AGAR|nr:hypothetical protein IW261DRAFT_1426328 [Armillaria novae-zelandiae]
MAPPNVSQEIDWVMQSYYHSSGPSISRLLYERDIYSNQSKKTSREFFNTETHKPYRGTLLGRLHYSMSITTDLLFLLLNNDHWFRLGPSSESLSARLLFDAQVNVLQGLYAKNQDECLSSSWIHGWRQKHILIYIEPLVVHAMAEEILHEVEGNPVKIDVSLTVHLFAVHAHQVQVITT